MPSLGLPQLSVDPVLWLPLWLGTLRDHSGAGRHATPDGSSLYWRSSGGVDGLSSKGTGRLVIANDATLEAITDSTFLAAGLVTDDPVRRRLFAKEDGGGKQLSIVLTESTKIELHDGVAARARDIGTWSGVESLCIRMESGQAADLYLNGSLDGPFNGVSTFTGDDADITILNLYAGIYNCIHPFGAFLWYPGLLTPAEILRASNYLQSRITPRRQWPGSGLRYPDRETNLLTDPLNPASWTLGSNAALSEQPGGVLRVAYIDTDSPYAYQVVLDIGSQYSAPMEARSDGVHVPRVQVGGVNWDGSTSADWQPVDNLTIAGNTSVLIQSRNAGAGYVEFRKVRAWTNPPGYTPRTGDPLFLDNIQTARRSLHTEASGKFSNTGMDIEAGQFELREDGVGRYAYCVSAGQLRVRLLGADGFDTALFTEEGGATITKDSTGFDLDFGTGDKVRAVQLASP